MKKTGINNINSKQFSYILMGTMIGIGAFRMPSDLAKLVYQDAWISAALGGIYPLAMIALGAYFIKRYPDKNVLILSKECFGSIIGGILNLIFALDFLNHLSTLVRGVSDLFLPSLMYFLSGYKMLIVVLLAGAYAAYKDLKLLGRLNSLVYTLTLALSAILLFGFKSGEYKNVLPVFGSGIVNVIKAGRQSITSYTGIEIFFLIYPFVTDKENAVSAAFKSVFITIAIYVWFTFISIYFLGADILPKYVWPVPTVPKAIEIPVISNFRFLFLVLWSLIVFKTIANAYFATAYIIKDFARSLSKKNIFIFVFFICFLISYELKDEVTRREILRYTTPVFLIFNLSFIISIIMITNLKKRADNEGKER